MPVHLFLSTDDQVVMAFFAVVFTGICVRYWRITLAVLAGLLIGAGLIALSVIIDLHIIHDITAYLHDVGHTLVRPLS